MCIYLQNVSSVSIVLIRTFFPPLNWINTWDILSTSAFIYFGISIPVYHQWELKKFHQDCMPSKDCQHSSYQWGDWLETKLPKANSVSASYSDSPIECCRSDFPDIRICKQVYYPSLLLETTPMREWGWQDWNKKKKIELWYKGNRESNQSHWEHWSSDHPSVMFWIQYSDADWPQDRASLEEGALLFKGILSN